MSVALSFLTGFYAFGGSIENVLQQWEYLGVFEYVLPFLLVFAIVFAILTNISILGQKKGINMVLALAIGLLSITSIEFRSFFRVIIPYTGIGLIVLLVVLILTGLFLSSVSWWNKAFLGLTAVVAVIVIISSLSSYKLIWGGGWWWSQYGDAIIIGIAVVLLILLVISPKIGGGQVQHTTNV